MEISILQKVAESRNLCATEIWSYTVSLSRQYSLTEILPLNLSEQCTYVKDHLSVDELLQGYLCLADSSLLMAVYNNLCVEVSLMMDKLMAEVKEMIGSSLVVTTDKDIDIPAKTYTTELVLKLALYFYDNNVSTYCNAIHSAIHTYTVHHTVIYIQCNLC